MMKLVFALSLLAASCPTPQPVPPDADASPAPAPPGPVDAAPTPAQDASPGSPSCQAACAVLSLYCKPQQPNCATVLDSLDRTHLIREPSGHPLTCTDIAGAMGATAVKALGVACP